LLLAKMHITEDTRSRTSQLDFSSRSLHILHNIEDVVKTVISASGAMLPHTNSKCMLHKRYY
jgi:hypothetical protein